MDKQTETQKARTAAVLQKNRSHRGDGGMTTFELEPYKRFRDATEYTALVMPNTAGEAGDRSSIVAYIGERQRYAMVDVAAVLNRLVALSSDIYTDDEVAGAVREMAGQLRSLPTAHEMMNKRAS